jgi:hypothetical protein
MRSPAWAAGVQQHAREQQEHRRNDPAVLDQIPCQPDDARQQIQQCTIQGPAPSAAGETEGPAHEQPGQGAHGQDADDDQQ